MMNTEIIRNVDGMAIARAAGIIREGGLVAFPTETVYGLGANALMPAAAAKIYEAKGRPSDNPLIIHLARAEDAEEYCFTVPLYYRLALAFMPGPLTVIMPKKDCIPMTVTGGLSTVAVRIPSNEIAHRLIAASGVPIAAPSANSSGKPSPTTAQHVIDDINGKVDMILDGGSCSIGLESTIVSLAQEDRILILRPGAVTAEMIREVCNGIPVDDRSSVRIREGEAPLAPGMKYRHYAPDAKVVILEGDKKSVAEYMACAAEDRSVGILCFEEYKDMIPGDNVVLFGHESDSEEQAHRLFDCLRKFNECKDVRLIYAPMPSKTGIGAALYNRMIKAAGFTIEKIE